MGLIVITVETTMSSIKSPPEKKRVAYERDHYAKGEYEKSFRKSWPRKKKKAGRRVRRIASGLTKAVGLDVESGEKIAAIKNRRLDKWEVPSLRESVNSKLARRVASIRAKSIRRQRQEIQK